jgi:hypothetical protein
MSDQFHVPIILILENNPLFSRDWRLSGALGTSGLCGEEKNLSPLSAMKP